MRVVLRWVWLDEDLHGKDLIGFYNKHENDDTACFIPRGHGKTLTAAARIIQYILKDPNIAIMFASATEKLALDFGAMVAKELINNDMLQAAFPDILPNKNSKLTAWGADGYELPSRRPRIDPTLFSASLKTNIVGRHPDIVFLDDLVVRTNNNPIGWEQAESFIKECKMLLPAQGVIHLTGTRWHDADPYGKIVEGKIRGKKGPFVLAPKSIRSCYVDDNPARGPIYCAKTRWNMSKETGYTKDQLDDMRKPEREGGLGEYFDAQMRNDPAPEERQDIKVSDINIYEENERPELSHVLSVGIEALGGGLLIYNQLMERLEKLNIKMPATRIEYKRKQGETKIDRIKGVLEPIVREGRLYAMRWMIGEKTESEGLGYEIRRFGKARHDDIVDALHNIPLQLSGGSYPEKGQPADLYISCDLAYTEEKRSDWSVCVAGAIDHENRLWVLDYTRFQISAPSAICDKIIEFYQKWERQESHQPRSRFNFAKSYR